MQDQGPGATQPSPKGVGFCFQNEEHTGTRGSLKAEDVQSICHKSEHFWSLGGMGQIILLPPLPILGTLHVPYNRQTIS